LLFGTPQEWIGDQNGINPVKIEILAYYPIPRFGKHVDTPTTHQLNRCLKLIERLFLEKNKCRLGGFDTKKQLGNKKAIYIFCSLYNPLYLC